MGDHDMQRLIFWVIHHGEGNRWHRGHIFIRHMSPLWPWTGGVGHFPQVQVVTASLDDGLNEAKYILPGLGDFGDRFFNTV